MSDYSRLCLHTITTKPWDIETAMEKYAAAGIGGITVWRQWLEGRNIARTGEKMRQNGLEIVSLCRGGFFPAKSTEKLQEALEDNRKALREAAELGAPLIVLVCGADPAQTLEISRSQILRGIEAILPLAEELGIKLGIEPLHPMYADNRSAINTMASANEMAERIDHPLVGIALDVYHTWWDPSLYDEIRRTSRANRLFAFHICDWLTPTTDFLNDRGLMGEGCIDLSGIRREVEAGGFTGFCEVEIFSERWWSRNQDEFLDAISASWFCMEGRS